MSSSNVAKYYSVYWLVIIINVNANDVLVSILLQWRVLVLLMYIMYYMCMMRQGAMMVIRGGDRWGRWVMSMGDDYNENSNINDIMKICVVIS